MCGKGGMGNIYEILPVIIGDGIITETKKKLYNLLMRK